MVLAFSMPTMAQSDDDEGWATAPSAAGSSGDDASYDGSTDSEFANDEEYASAYARYKAETTKKSEINRMLSIPSLVKIPTVGNSVSRAEAASCSR